MNPSAECPRPGNHVLDIPSQLLWHVIFQESNKFPGMLQVDLSVKAFTIAYAFVLSWCQCASLREFDHSEQRYQCAVFSPALCPSHGITYGMAKSISMQGALKHIMEYVYNMSSLMSAADVQALADEQAGKAVDLITTCKVDPITSYEDGNAALLELQSGRCLWSADQKTKLAAAIRVKVEGTKARGSDQQDNHYSAEYMPEWIWDLIRSHCDINHVFEHVATHCVVKLKLRSPSEPTRRDLVAMCLAGRCVTPTVGESLNHIELMRKHFECARSIHQGVKGPAMYPSDPNLFLQSLAVKLEDADLPVASKVSKHALSLLVASTRCRKKKDEAAYSVKSERRIVKKQPQEELKSEDAVDHIARFVAGEIASPDVATLPGVAAVLRGCGPAPKDEPLPAPTDGAPSPAPMSDVPVVLPKPVGDLEELRSITAKKFAMGGVDLSDGSVVPPAKRPKPTGVVMARPAAATPSPVAMARPAAATPSGPSGCVMKKPAAVTPSCVVMAKPAAATPVLPKGWSYQLRSLKSGRRYPVWTSKTGKMFYSWKAVQRVV